MRSLAGVFFKLGVTGFGGPAAHIALMREEFVRRREWMTDSEFLEMVGITNLIPGPNSTELAMHIGSRRAGSKGLITAGLCFIVPAVIIVSFFAYLYEVHGQAPAIVDVRYGVLPVIIAIVAHAVTGLGRSTITSLRNGVLAVGSFVLYFVGMHELLVLLVGGLVAVIWSHVPQWKHDRKSLSLLVPISMYVATLQSKNEASLIRVFLLFLQIGAVLYGSGYVLLAFLENRLVDDLGWLTSQELLDGIAIGQITPGPLFSTATFIGWQVAGVWGAVMATTGIFLPSFLFVALLTVIVPWVKRHAVVQTFVWGVTVSSLGLMAAVLVRLIDDALVDWFTVLITVASLTVLLKTKINVTWLVIGGVAIGLARNVL